VDLLEEDGRRPAALLPAALEVGRVAVDEAAPFCARLDTGRAVGAEVGAHRVAIETHRLRHRPLGVALRDEIPDPLVAGYAGSQARGLLAL